MTLPDISGVAEGSVFVEKRKIRSAGKTTGSVELTLPQEFFTFEGQESVISIVEGRQPKLVITPDVDLIHASLENLWTCIHEGYQLCKSLFPVEAVEFVFTDTLWHQDRFQTNLRDCGLLTRQLTNTRSSANALNIVYQMSRMVLQRSDLGLSKSNMDFLSKAGVFTVFNDNYLLDLFEMDTVEIILADKIHETSACNSAFLEIATWHEARHPLGLLLEHVVYLEKNQMSVGDQKDHWSRAQRIASKVI